MRELEFIEWIRSRGLPGARRGRVKVGPGDDCAVLAGEGREFDLLMKTDGLVEGVHFDACATAGKVGYKAVCRPLSDIAASGGEPVAAVVFAALNEKHAGRWARSFQKGLTRAAGLYGCPVVGGDISGTPGPTTIATSLLGRVRKGGALLRSRARSSDRVFVTGRLGGSITGKHLRFKPRLEEGRFLAGFSGVGAVIDVSDGLGRDLAHILKESGGLGAELSSAKIPIAAAARRLKGDALEHALRDGEDYELLFTVRSKRSEAFRAKWSFETQLTEIGVILGRGKRMWLTTGEGKRRSLQPGGWQHL